MFARSGGAERKQLCSKRKNSWSAAAARPQQPLIRQRCTAAVAVQEMLPTLALRPQQAQLDVHLAGLPLSIGRLHKRLPARQPELTHSAKPAQNRVEDTSPEP